MSPKPETNNARPCGCTEGAIGAWLGLAAYLCWHYCLSATPAELTSTWSLFATCLASMIVAGCVGKLYGMSRQSKS